MTPSDYAAWFGAVLATIVFIWEVAQWWLNRGTSLRVRASPNMREFTQGLGFTSGPAVMVEVVNTGDRATTLTHFVGEHYTGWWTRLRRKTETNFFVPDPGYGQPLPYVLEPGQRWLGKVEQNEDIEKWSRDDRLYLGVNHSLAKKAHVVRVIIKDDEPEPLETDAAADS